MWHASDPLQANVTRHLREGICSLPHKGCTLWPNTRNMKLKNNLRLACSAEWRPENVTFRTDQTLSASKYPLFIRPCWTSDLSSRSIYVPSSSSVLFLVSLILLKSEITKNVIFTAMLLRRFSPDSRSRTFCIPERFDVYKRCLNCLPLPNYDGVNWAAKRKLTPLFGFKLRVKTYLTPMRHWNQVFSCLLLAARSDP